MQFLVGMSLIGYRVCGSTIRQKFWIAFSCSMNMQKFLVKHIYRYDVWYLLQWPKVSGWDSSNRTFKLNQSKIKCLSLILWMFQSLLKMMIIDCPYRYWNKISLGYYQIEKWKLYQFLVFQTNFHKQTQEVVSCMSGIHDSDLRRVQFNPRKVQILQTDTRWRKKETISWMVHYFPNIFERRIKQMLTMNHVQCSCAELKLQFYFSNEFFFFKQLLILHWKRKNLKKIFL